MHNFNCLYLYSYLKKLYTLNTSILNSYNILSFKKNVFLRTVNKNYGEGVKKMGKIGVMHVIRKMYHK